MICDFPAIYAKICDEISALLPLVSTELQQFRACFLFHFKISIFPGDPHTIFMRCARDIRVPKIC